MRASPECGLPLEREQERGGGVSWDKGALATEVHEPLRNQSLKL